MKRRVALLTVLATLALIGATNVPAGAGPGNSPAGTTAHLQMYTVVADQAGRRRSSPAGTTSRRSSERPAAASAWRSWRIRHSCAALEKFGTVELWRNDAGLTSSQLAVQQAAAGYKVWRDYDGSDGLRQYMYDLEAANEDILDLKVIGHTWAGPRGGPDNPREIIALRLSANDIEGDVDDGSKPAVLYSSTIHAREWIATEVNRRLLEWFIKGWREEKPDVVNILNTEELWFVLVQNPDGYQYTFDVDRLWRKNLRDNDGVPGISSLDGVDGNRNFAEHWNYDDEGSGTITSDETYRGPAPFSEPETRAIRDLVNVIHPKYHISYHSFGQLLLYPFGFQVNTPSADDPIYVAWAGTDKKPAVQGFNPGVGADLYTTNGEQTDWAAADEGALAITPELSEGNDENGFEFPDSEGEIQHEFNINKDFAVAAAKSATDPDNPVSPVNIKTQPFYTNFAKVDPQKSFNPMSDFTFAHSFNGDDQLVQVLARRDLDNDGDDGRRLAQLLHQRRPAGDGCGDGRVGRGRSLRRPGRHLLPRRGRATCWTHRRTATSRSGSRAPARPATPGRSTSTRRPPDDVLILADTDYTGTSNFPAYPAGTTRRRPCPSTGRRRGVPGYGPTTSTTWTRWAQRPTTSACSALRRGDLVHGERPALSDRGTARRDRRRDPGEHDDAAGPRVPERGRPAPVHGPPRRVAVRERVRLQPGEHPAALRRRRPDGERRVPVPVGRLPPVLAGRVPVRRRRRGDARTATLRRGRDGRPVRRRRPPLRGRSTSRSNAGRGGHEPVVHHDEQHPEGSARDYPQFTSTAPAKWDTGLAGAYSPHNGSTQYALLAAGRRPVPASDEHVLTHAG